MDPSNNNAFDSFGNNAGAGNGASVGGAGVGIGSSATITSPNTGATNSGSIVSSGATAVNNEYASNFPEGGLTIGGDKKRSRKGLIIAGIVFFVLAIGGGLAALAAMNGVFGGGNQFVRDADVKKAYYNFANYALNGVDSEEPDIGEYDNNRQYYFMTHQSSEEEQNELFESIQLLLNSFTQKYSNLQDKSLFTSDIDAMNVAIENENDLFDFMRVIYVKPSLKRSDIENEYVKSGGEGVTSYVGEYYAIQNYDDNNEYLTGFLESYNEWTTPQVTYLDILKANECISEQKINWFCPLDDATSARLKELNSQTVAASSDLVYYYGLSKVFVQNIYDMRRIVKGNIYGSN